MKRYFKSIVIISLYVIAQQLGAMSKEQTHSLLGQGAYVQQFAKICLIVMWFNYATPTNKLEVIFNPYLMSAELQEKIQFIWILQIRGSEAFGIIMILNTMLCKRLDLLSYLIQANGSH